MSSRTDRRPSHEAAPKRRSGKSRRSGFGGTVLGLFIGIALGLGLAAAVAFYLNKGATPYQSATPGRESPREATKETAKPGRTDAFAPEKPRFDFYKILPGAEEAKSVPGRGPEKLPERAPDRATVDAAKASEPQPKAGDRFWLQAGAFGSEADAENLKARLALSGWEATMQSVTLPDKSARYRVRLGPYDNADEVNRMKTELGSRGFEVSVIKNP